MSLPMIGPDATGAGWVYEYAVIDRSHQHSLAELRSLQDWYLRFQLETVPGVAEVASIGGFVRQYQVNLDPNKLRAYNIPLSMVIDRVRDSTNEVGGRVLEMAGARYMIRGLGYLRSLQDLESVPVATKNGTPVLVRDLGTVAFGPDIREGVAEWNGEGEVVGGIIVMRDGMNALNVIDGVKKRLAEIKPALPAGVEIVSGYDRSGLIHESIKTLQRDLLLEVAYRQLCNHRLPVPFPLRACSHSGTADCSRRLLHPHVFPPRQLEHHVARRTGARHWCPYRRLHRHGRKRLPPLVGTHGDCSSTGTEVSNEEGKAILIGGAKQVGPAIFFSLLVILVSFLPVFLLEAQEGRMFRPLAWTKTLSVAFSSILAITLVPVLMVIFIRGHLRPESENPFSRWTQALYLPVLRFCLRYRKTTLASQSHLSCGHFSPRLAHWQSVHASAV